MDYDSIDEYDDDLFKGQADRAALAALPELDREMVLAERYERRQARQELLSMRAARRDAELAAAEPATKRRSSATAAPRPKRAKNVYTAERIVEERMGDGGAAQYLVRWEGYDESHDTWEPAENLLDPALLEDWAQAQEDAEAEAEAAAAAAAAAVRSHGGEPRTARRPACVDGGLMPRAAASDGRRRALRRRRRRRGGRAGSAVHRRHSSTALRRLGARRGG